MRIVFVPEKYDAKSTEVSIPLSQENEKSVVEATRTIKNYARYFEYSRTSS